MDENQLKDVGNQLRTIASIFGNGGTQSVETEITEQGAEIGEQGDELEILEEHFEIPKDGQIIESEYICDSLLGMTRKTIDEMYELYCEHSKGIGFSVRKDTTRLSTTGVVLSKMFLCSCAGLRKTKTGTSKQKMFGITRTNCKALMTIKLVEGVYEVVKHEMAHNHQLTRKEWSHLHRSRRGITNEKGKAIEQMMISGMRATDSFNYMVHEAGGEESVGHTKRDHQNYVSNWKMERIEVGDAQTFFDMIVAENKKDQEFFLPCEIRW